MRVSEAMSRQVRTVEMDDTLQTIKLIFDNADFHHLLVVEAGRLMGVISDRDLLRAVSPYVNSPAERPRDLQTLHRKAHQIMTRHPITVSPDDPLSAAVEPLLERRVSALPVIDGDWKLHGILTWRDVLRAGAGRWGWGAP